MGDFLTGLALMAIGGLAATAINYPLGFKRINGILGFLAFLGSVFYAGFLTGLGSVVGALKPFIPKEQSVAAELAAEAAKGPEWLPWAGFLFSLFLIFLVFLRSILGISDDRGDTKDEQSLR